MSEASPDDSGRELPLALRPVGDVFLAERREPPGFPTVIPDGLRRAATKVSRGKETPGYGANRLRRIGADEWVLVRGVWDSESYRNKRLLDWRRAEGTKPHYRNMVSTPTF